MAQAKAVTTINHDMGALVKGVFSDDSWRMKTGIGGIISAAMVLVLLYNAICLPVSVALWAVLIGYNLRCIRARVEDPAGKLPEWNEWGDLFMSGITWIALQTGVWLLLFGICSGLLLVAAGFALNEQNLMLTQLLSTSAAVISILLYLAMGFISSYLMVNFAVEANINAGFAYIKVIKALSKNPLHLFTGFILATGFFSLCLILPTITIIGFFLLPSFFFLGNVISSLILGQHWAEINQSEKSD